MFHDLLLRLCKRRVRNGFKHGVGVDDVSAAQQRGADGSNARA